METIYIQFGIGYKMNYHFVISLRVILVLVLYIKIVTFKIGYVIYELRLFFTLIFYINLFLYINKPFLSFDSNKHPPY